MTPSRPLLVLGSHRAGTSATTRLLTLLGVELGPEGRLLAGIEGDNALGFFEHEELMQLDDELLQRLGGTWRDPPRLEPGWECSPELEELRVRARELVQRDFAGRPLWAFKDPRLALTLPFWETLLEPAGFVVCSRSPLDVARSLERRNGLPLDAGVALWTRSTAAALVATAGRRRCLVSYRRLLEDPPTVLRRLAARLDLAEPDEVALAEAAGWIDPELRHHHAAVADLVSDDAVPREAVDLHLLFEEAAGDAGATAEAALDRLAARLVAERPRQARPVGPRPFRAVAMLQVYNERRFLAGCIEHLREQGIGVHVIDNESTDGTLELAERYLGRGVVGLETLPRHGVFALREQCARQEELAATLDADWLLHHDADEIRLSPRRGQSLVEALREADEAGYNAVDFVEFAFVPTREQPDHDHASFRRTLRSYYPYVPAVPHRCNAWKRQDGPVDLRTTGGHVVKFDGRRISPTRLHLLHYLYLSREHAMEKFVRRRFADDEVADGWFGWRPWIGEDALRLPSAAELRVANETEPLDDSEPLTRHLLDDGPVRWTESATDALLHEAFALQVRRRGRATAIATGDGPISYAELDELANRFAALLAGRGDGPVALLCGHGASLVAAALAVSKVGAAAVALSPADPPARLRAIVQELEPAALLVTQDLLGLAAATGLPADRILDLSRAPEVGRPVAASAARPEDPAFLICTSGTTGRAKVVVQTHRSLLHNVLRYSNGLGLREDDRVAWLAALSGGQGMATVWSTLLNGATLCPFAVRQRGVTGLVDWLEGERITVFDTLPSILRTLARTLPAGRRIGGVRLVRLASEAAFVSDLELVRVHFPADCLLASVLASSEAGIMAQAVLPASAAGEGERLPVGEPAEGLELVLRGDDGAPVPDGEVGELVVRGRFLSPGYWNDPSLTAERFGGQGELREYRTGDLARRGAAGIVVAGRRDGQVKVRGFRVQLEEVETALARRPEVGGAIVRASVDARGDARLTAYVTPQAGAEPDAAALRAALAEELPPQAVPTAFVVLDAFPLTDHGKVDRERLPAEPPEATPGAPRPPLASEVDDELLRLWTTALDRTELDPARGFLELGGDSLSAAIVAAGIHARSGVELDLAVFAANPTLGELAALVARAEPGGARDRYPLRRRAGGLAAPLSFAQESLWNQAPGRATALNLAVQYELRGPLDVDALRAALDAVVERHEILRTTFVERAGSPVQIVVAPTPTGLVVEDASGAADPPGRADELLAADARAPFDLGAAPPLRLRLLRLAEDEHRLLVTAHHLICDAPSWRVLFDEVRLHYEAALAGTRAELPPLAVQFGDWAAWERASLDPASPTFERELAWWHDAFAVPPVQQPLPFAPGAGGPGVRAWRLAAERTTALDRLGRKAGATFFATRLAVFAALLAVEGGGEERVLETFVTTRRRAEVQGLVGPFINRSFLRLRLEGDPSFSGWLPAVGAAVVELGRHSALPFDVLWRRLDRLGVERPRSDVKFEALYPVRTRLGDVRVRSLDRAYVAPLGLTVAVGRDQDGELGRAVFDAGAFDDGDVRGFVDRLARFAEAVCEHPDEPLRGLHAAIVQQG